MSRRWSWRVVAPVITLVLVLSSCGVHRTGTSATGSSTENGVTTDAGYSNQPIDQPLPFPALHPKSDPEGGCEWLADAMPSLGPLQFTHWKRAPGAPMCQLWGADTLPYAVQVRVGAQYTPYEFTKQLDQITVAGLHGRRYVFDSTDDSTFCSVELDLRAYATLGIDAFDFDQSNPTNHDNKANCAVAERTADILARRYVPLAGGAPWPNTPQQPDKEVLSRLKPCGFIEDTILTDIPEVKPERAETRLGNTCTYKGRHGTLKVLITTGTDGLDDFPRQFAEPPPPVGPKGVPLQPRQSSDPPQNVRDDIKFGGHYKSREERGRAAAKRNDHTSCVVAIETEAGHVIAVTYTGFRTVPDNCAIARINVADGLLDALVMT